MKIVLLLFALLAISYAADRVRCPVKVDDNFVLEGTFHGSAYPEGQKSTVIYSVVGVVEEAIDYDGGIMMINTSVAIANVVNGTPVGMGWNWTLVTAEGIYTMSKFNGVVKKCEFHKVVFPIPQMSKIVANTFQLYHYAEKENKFTDPAKPKYIICQGAYLNEIENFEFIVEGDSDPKFAFSSSLSNTTNVYTEVLGIRKLRSSDSGLFDNPCKHNAMPSGKKINVHLSLYDKFRGLLLLDL